MIVLGIDPGTRVAGYGLVERSGKKSRALDYGCIRPPASAPLSMKYRHIFRGVQELISLHQPSAMAVEGQFLQHNPQSALKLGMALAAAVLAASLEDLPVFRYPPARIKSSVVGNGRASKQQVQYMVQQTLELATPPKPEDAADALAAALCHLHAEKAPQLIKSARF